MKKYAVMLCDDEALIIEGLRKMISWEGLDCFICASACSGKKGKESIDVFRPDIIITDIRMPDVSGLEIAEYALMRNPNTKVIIVSAYADFEYAQRGMRAGIVDYLLKPIDRNELTAALQKALNSIKEQEKHIKKERMEEVWTLAENSLLFNLARLGTVGVQGNREVLRERARRAGVVITIEFFNLTEECTSVVAKGQHYYGVGLLQAGYDPAFDSDDERVVIICPFQADRAYEIARNRILEILRMLQRETPAELNTNVICVSDIYRDERELQKCYKQSIEMSRQAFFANAPALISTVKEEKKVQETGIQELLTELKNGQKECVDRFFQVWRRQMLQGMDRSLTLSRFRELQREVTLFAAHLGMNTEDLWKNEVQHGNFQRRFEVLKTGVDKVILFIQKTANPISRSALYVEDHYGELDLSLEKIAGVVGVSGSYLSRAFKERYAVNFSEYLAEVRIRHAKFFLETSDQKIYTIAERVGYGDAHYFNQVFKKRTGISPQEWRKRYGTGQNITT